MEDQHAVAVAVIVEGEVGPVAETEGGDGAAVPAAAATETPAKTRRFSERR
ncbi:hypothetical protein [Streptomyces sp. HC307]|uniref:hypothetical protein n=1 Tax=Streptomyces flavusporus TaxID=3385496 RepID=UPI0039175D55